MTEKIYQTRPSAMKEPVVPAPPEAQKKDTPAQASDESAQTNDKSSSARNAQASVDIAREETRIIKLDSSTETPEKPASQTQETAQTSQKDTPTKPEKPSDQTQELKPIRRKGPAKYRNPARAAADRAQNPADASQKDAPATPEKSEKAVDISQEPTRIIKLDGPLVPEPEKPADISQEPTRIIKLDGPLVPESKKPVEPAPENQKDAPTSSKKPGDIALEPTQIFKMDASLVPEPAKPVDIAQEMTQIIKMDASAMELAKSVDLSTPSDPPKAPKPEESEPARPKNAPEKNEKPENTSSVDISQEPTRSFKMESSTEAPERPVDISEAQTRIIKKDPAVAALMAEALRAETTQAALVRISKEDLNKEKQEKSSEDSPSAPLPAKMPKHSRAAAAQRLGDRPDKTTPGVFYEAANTPVHVPKWWTRRHLKRKNMRLTQERFVASEKRITMRMFLPIGIGTLLVVLVATSLLVYLNATTNATNAQYQPQIVTLADILPQDNLKLYDSSGNLLYQATDQGLQTSEPLDKISKNLQNAEIDIEDQTFWNNSGYDITGIVRAAISDLSSGQVVSGASTITQQLIKNTVVGDSETAQRKLQEIELAPSVTRYYTKQQILAMYLNTVYYSNGANGAEAAAQTYFGLQDKPGNPASNQLDIAQAATLAGIPSNPTFRDPIAYPQNSLKRTQDVLHQMYVLHTINAQQYNDALQEIRKPGFVSYHAPVQSPHALALSSFTNYAVTELASDLHVKVADLSRSGLKVTTTVNSNLQTQVLSAAQRDIAAIRDAHNIHDSSVVMINPKTGAVEVLIGNIDPANNSFNVATQGFRQSGSTMKAFTYALAFEHGISPGQKTYDEPETFYYDGVPYHPDNYAGSHYGWITYRQALDWSLNIDAVRLELTPQVGPINAYNFAESTGLGATNGVVNETFTLGALGVHLLNETSAFGSFANAGVHVAPHAISTVTNVNGKVIYRASTAGKRVLSPQAAYVLSDVLSDNATRDKEFYPCSALDLYVNNKCPGGTVIPAAVKTGTTDNFVDNLTVGYTPSLVTGVWSGNDDNTPMNNIIGVTGAGTIWHDAMMAALQGKPIEHFTNPGGVIMSPIYHDLVKQ